MKQTTLFGGLFGGVDVEIGSNDGLLLKKARGSLTPNVTVSAEDIYERAEVTFSQVRKLLPHITHELVTTQQRLQEFLEEVREAKVIAIDTEVDGLNPLRDQIAGFSAYTGEGNPIYVSINHAFRQDINLDVKWFFKEISNMAKRKGLKVIMHNCKYDIQVLYAYSGVFLDVYADTMVAAHMLNENEPKGLKYQWNKYCMGSRYGADTYSDLFDKRKFSTFNPEKVYVYATLDVVMTLQLWKFQEQFLVEGFEFRERYGLQKVGNLYFNLEMPVVKIAAEMEISGVAFDKDLNKQLQIKYEKKLRESNERLMSIINPLLEENKGNIPPKRWEKISIPMNPNSDAQLEIFLYDGLRLELSDKVKKGIVRKKKKSQKDKTKAVNSNSVGKEAMEYFEIAYPEYKELFDAINEHKELTKVYTGFIVGLRDKLDPISNRIHASWNPNGTKTGRFSSSDPNL